MGDLKNQAMPENEDVQQFKLTDSEANYLRLLNLALQYHTMQQKLLSGWLYQLCVLKYGYKDGMNLQLAFDFNDPNNLLTVTLLPADFKPPVNGPVPPMPNGAPVTPPAASGDAPNQPPTPNNA